MGHPSPLCPVHNTDEVLIGCPCNDWPSDLSKDQERATVIVLVDGDIADVVEAARRVGATNVRELTNLGIVLCDVTPDQQAWLATFPGVAEIERSREVGIA